MFSEMRKRRFLCVSVLFFVITFSMHTPAQSQPSRFEIGAQFSTLFQNPAGSTSLDDQIVGGGVRFAYNVHRYAGIEAEVNFFADDDRGLGRKTMALFGVKAGKRGERFGVFGKLRPGFTRGNQELRDCSAPNPTACSFIKPTEFTLDLGGVVEFYPSSRLLLRFDAGNTRIHYKLRNTLDTNNGVTILLPYFGGDTTNNFQFSAGVGIRF